MVCVTAMMPIGFRPPPRMRPAPVPRPVPLPRPLPVPRPLPNSRHYPSLPNINSPPGRSTGTGIQKINAQSSPTLDSVGKISMQNKGVQTSAVGQKKVSSKATGIVAEKPPNPKDTLPQSAAQPPVVSSQPSQGSASDSVITGTVVGGAMGLSNSVGTIGAAGIQAKATLDSNQQNIDFTREYMNKTSVQSTGTHPVAESSANDAEITQPPTFPTTTIPTTATPIIMSQQKHGDEAWRDEALLYKFISIVAVAIVVLGGCGICCCVCLSFRNNGNFLMGAGKRADAQALRMMGLNPDTK